MNIVSIHLKTLICAIAIGFSPVYAIKSEAIKVDKQEEQNNNTPIWYKKRSTQIIAATSVAIMALYAMAVYKNKIMGPIALLAALYGAEKSVPTINKIDNTTNKINDKGKSETTTAEVSVNLDPSKNVVKEKSKEKNKNVEEKKEVADSKKSAENKDSISQPKEVRKTGLVYNVIDSIFREKKEVGSVVSISTESSTQKNDDGEEYYSYR